LSEKTNVEWYEKLYGEKPTETKYPTETLTVDEGETVKVKFLESKPRVVSTSFGDRGVITVLHEGIEKSLWLSRKDLARQIALLQKSVGDLKGMIVEITCLGKGKMMYRYQIRVVKPSEKAVKG